MSDLGGAAKWLGLIAVTLASVNIFGGFAVTAADARDVQEKRAAGREVMRHGWHIGRVGA